MAITGFVRYNDYDVCFVPDQQDLLDFHGANTLKQYYMGRYVAPSSLRVNQCLLFPLNASCLVENQQISV